MPEAGIHEAKVVQKDSAVWFCFKKKRRIFA